MVKRKLFSSALFSAVLLFSTPNKATPILPEILDGSILEEIRGNKGHYNSNGKIYSIWAFREGTEELGRFSQCPFLNLPELQSYKAARVSESSRLKENHIFTYKKDASITEEQREFECFLALVTNKAQKPVSCGVETSNLFLNPEIKATFDDEEESIEPRRIHSFKPNIEILAYRLHNRAGQAIKDFLLIYLGKGSISKEEHFNALRKQCTDLLQEATILSSPLE